MTCRRCGHESDEQRMMYIPRIGDLSICELCLDHLYAWMGLVPPLPPEPTLVPEPPFSLYYED